MNDLILAPRHPREQSFEAYIPEHAPFSEEQRAWLNGFLAGLFSRAPAASGTSAPPPDAKTLQPLTILFGTQTGNAEVLAKRAAKTAAARGFAPTIRDLAQCHPSTLGREKQALVIISTYGDGEPPDSARTFWELLHGETAPELPGLRFSVCGLGDTNYPKFCQCGKDLDRRLNELKAQPVFPRADCDVEYERTFVQWLDGALRGLAENGTGTAREGAEPLLGDDRAAAESSTAESVLLEPAYSRRNPFPAPLTANRLLSGAGSAKEIRHFEFSLENSGLRYQAGDALAVFPENCPERAGEIIQALGCAEDVPVPAPGGAEVPLRQALLRNYDITRIPKALLEHFAHHTGDPILKRLTSPEANGELEKFLWGREVIDLLLAHPECKVPPATFAGMLKKLQPRLYSISSSPLKHPDQAHLTIAVVRYQSLGRARKGICSSFLADRVPAGSAAPVFLHANKNFRPPADASRPMIMVGPGTGIAPFRGFLQERQALGAPGKNWLFFGDQHAAADFLYREELEDFFRNGTLTRFDTAFSRDQPEKVYVQRRMVENARELFAWLEEGAHFYVCGDASRMARDVDAALHEAIQSGGGRTPEQAAEYVRQMKTAKRYQRDVY